MPRPRVIIGVAGGSGSGKTTVVRRILDSLGPDHPTVLDHDRYYRDCIDLRLEERAALNYDHPDALETELMVRHVGRLKAAEPELIVSRRAVIVEGILVLCDPALRQLMDIKVFVDDTVAVDLTLLCSVAGSNTEHDRGSAPDGTVGGGRPDGP